MPPAKKPAKTAPKKAAKRSVKKAPAKPAKKTVAPGRIEILSVNSPGYRSTVDATRYEAMRAALFRALPKSPPRITQAEMFAAVKGKLPESVFPGQEKSEWWVKCVQLDQEARGGVKCTLGSPLRWYRA